jgi:phospholipid/cholesterol/gamma-HCH transport system substrate-binding protein
MVSSRNIKVGAFVLAGLLIIGFIVFLIGDERQLFIAKQEYRINFKDVEGLRRGSPVNMGGVTVGTVSGVSYSQNPKDAIIYVTVEVSEDEAQRIRTDSVATIEARGLLGDKLVSISVGSPSKPLILPGGVIPSKEGGDITQALKRLSGVTERVENVVKNLETTTKSFADEQLHRDMKEGISSLSNILKSMDQGDGYAARILHDPKEADRLSGVVKNLEQTSAELGRTAQGVNAIVGRIQRGPGFAHEIIYGDGPGRAVEQFGGAAEELRITLKGIREGNGMAKSLIYGDEGSEQLMANLNEMSADLKHIVKDARAGKGTIGALLVDPSVYEDIKMVLGNVGRNKALRALVRYSIKRDEKSGKGGGSGGPARASGSLGAASGGAVRRDDANEKSKP